MKFQECSVTDIREFSNVAAELRNKWFPKRPTWGPWFRGQAQENWHLTPNLYRGEPTIRDIREVEDELRQEFMMRAPGLRGLGDEHPKNMWEWYFLMQHCNAPTR